MTSTATVEETPEQVLARLERYAASIGISAPRPGQRPAPLATSRELRLIGFEAMGYVVGLACCVAAIFAFRLLDRSVATAIIAGLVLGGVLATTRRVPLALWWTLGFAIGGMLALVVSREPRALPSSRLPAPLVRRVRLAARQPGQPARTPARRDHRAARDNLPGRCVGCGGDVAFRAGRPPRRRAGRSPAPSTRARVV